VIRKNNTNTNNNNIIININTTTYIKKEINIFGVTSHLNRIIYSIKHRMIIITRSNQMNIEHKNGNCYSHPRMYFENNLGIPPCHNTNTKGV